MTVFSLNEVLSLPLELPSRRFCLERLELLGDAALRCETDGLMGSWGEFSTKLKSILGGWLVGGLVGWLVGWFIFQVISFIMLVLGCLTRCEFGALRLNTNSKLARSRPFA